MERNPVLLVHGIFRRKTVFNRMSIYLSSLGWEVHSFDLKPSNARLGLDKLAEQISAYITHHFAPNQPIDLVGLSMGGLVSRYYVQRLRGNERVKRFVTIASPHYGTWLAYTLPFIGCIQMRPGSVFLQDLNRDLEILAKVNFTSIWTPYDFVIVPAQSCRLGIGQEIKLPIFAHAMMVRDKRTLQALVQALSLPISN